MATPRTISVRLAVDNADAAKAVLQGFGAAGAKVTDQLRDSLEALGNKDFLGRFADQLGAAAVRINTAQKAVANAQQSGDIDALSAAQARLTAATQGYGTQLEQIAARLDPAAGAALRLKAALNEIAAAQSAGALASDRAAAATATATAQYEAQIEAITGEKAALAASGAESDRKAASIEALRIKYDSIFASSRRYETGLNEIGVLEKEGALTAAGAAAAREHLTATYAAANAPIASAGAATALHTKALNDNSLSAGNAAFAQRQLSVQITQAISGIATGQPVFTTFVQQGHQVLDVAESTGAGFKGMGQAALGLFNSLGGLPVLIGVTVVGSIVALGVAAEGNASRLATLREQLRATHDDYSALAASVDVAAKQVAASTAITTAAAREAAQTIASAKYFNGTSADIEKLTVLSGDLARVWNVDLAKASAVLKDAINDPAAAVKKFADEGLPGFTGALEKTVASLQLSGQRGAAFQLVLDQLSSSAKGAATDQSPLQAALHALGESFTGAATGGKSFANSLGEYVTSAATLAVQALGSVIDALNRASAAVGTAIDAAKKGAGNLVPAVGQPVDEYGRAYPGGPPAVAPPAGGSSVLSSLPSAIQPLLQIVADQKGIDVELLARLQRSENAAPAANGQYATSSAGAVGAFQIKPGTFAGIPGFAGQDINSLPVNVAAGASLFARLLSKYGDPQLAILAYHDGEGTVDGVLNGKPGVSFSQDALTQAGKVTAGYSGTGFAQPTGAVAASVKPSTEQYGPPASLAGTGISSSVVNETRANVDAADSEAKSLGLLADARQKLINERDGFTKALADPEAHLSADQVNTYKAAIADLTGKINDAKSPADLYIRSLKDAGAAAAAETAGDQALAQVRERIAEIERSTGTTFTAAQRADAEGTAVANLSASLRGLEADLGRQIVNQGALATAYETGNQAVLDTTAKQQAYQTLLTKFPQDSAAITAALPALAAQYEALARSQAVTATAQQNAASNDNIALIKAETDSLGLNDQVRNRLIATLKAEQEEHRKFGDVLPPEAQQYIALAAATSDASSKLAAQQQVMSDLTGAVSSAADAITNGITQSFLQGSGAAVNWGTIISGIETQVAGLIAKLLIVNPLLNALDGTSRPTIDSIGGLLGNVFGNSSGALETTAVAAGSAAGLLAKGDTSTFEGGGVSTDSAGNITGGATAAAGSGGISLTQGLGVLGAGSKLLGGSVTDYISSVGNTVANYAAGVLSSTVGDAAAATATNLALNAAGPGIEGVATAGSFTAGVATTEASALGITGAATDAAVQGAATAAAGAGAEIGSAAATAGANAVAATSEAATAAIGTATSVVASALPAIGAAISVVSDLVSGNYRGAAFVAAGAVIGTAILPGIGTAVGAVVGGLVDSLFPQHPKNPYANTEVNVQNGQLSPGKQVSQLESTASAADSITSFNDQLHTYLDKVGVLITNPDGKLGDLGNNLKGTQQNTSINDLFNRLTFGNNPNDTSNFGVAKGALDGLKFNDVTGLNNELLKIASFSDAMSSLGIKLGSVGTDLTNISVASVSLTGALQDAADATSGAAPADQAPLSPEAAQLRIALSNDLPGQTFANTDALSAEIDKVNTFVNGTIPGLLNPILKSTSQLQTQIEATNQTYGAAIAQAAKYGLQTQALIDAQTKADELILAAGRKQLDQANAAVSARFTVATTGTTLDTTLLAFDTQAQAQRDALDKALTDVYGDSVRSTQYYGDQINNLEKTLGAERLKTAQDYAAQVAAALLGVGASVYSVRARQFALNGDQQDADLTNYDIKAAQETASYSKTLTDFYGAQYASSAEYQGYMTELENVQQGERLAIVQKYATATTATVSQAAQDQAAAAAKAAQDYATAQSNVTSLFGSLTSYASKLQTGSNSPLSPTDQYAAALSQFQAVSGAAAAGDYKSASQLTGYSDTLLAASRAVNGSGAAYGADFNKVVNAIGSVTAVSDQLTASAQRDIQQAATDQVVAAVAALQAEVANLRREMQQQTRALAA